MRPALKSVPGRTLAQVRNEALKNAIAEEIRRFTKEDNTTRRCAWCGGQFDALNRYHFFDEGSCRKAWYAGQFHPKKKGA